MFDFEKLDLYQLVKQINVDVLNFLDQNDKIADYLVDHWKAASMDVVLNLVEVTGRMAPEDKKELLTEARGSVFNCVAILEAIYGLDQVTEEEFQKFYDQYEQASKMLLGMYRSYDRPRNHSYQREREGAED